ncbi:MAG: hypothetical protein KC478_10340 [Bacteriovoracaceae bacterium]|nr:hypothetical protein [Bacteriovoracaceae bacterium]
MNQAIEITPKDLQDLIPTYIENTFNDYAELKACYEHKNAKGLKEVCHRILGTASAYGFIKLDEICTNVSRAIEAEKFGELMSLIKDLDQYFYYLERSYKR